MQDPRCKHEYHDCVQNWLTVTEEEENDDESDKRLEARDHRYSCLTFQLKRRYCFSDWKPADKENVSNMKKQLVKDEWIGAIALLIATFLVRKWEQYEQYQMRYCKWVKDGWNRPHKWSIVLTAFVYLHKGYCFHWIWYSVSSLETTIFCQIRKIFRSTFLSS